MSQVAKRDAGVRGSLVFPGLLTDGGTVVLVIVTYHEGGWKNAKISQAESLLDGAGKFDTESLGWMYICYYVYLSLVSTGHLCAGLQALC